MCVTRSSVRITHRLAAAYTMCVSRSYVRITHTIEMAELVPLAEGVGALVRDGDSVALEGFTHLIPFAAGHELLRQGRRELELIRMTPDILYDQMIGIGA